MIKISFKNIKLHITHIFIYEYGCLFYDCVYFMIVFIFWLSGANKAKKISLLKKKA